MRNMLLLLLCLVFSSSLLAQDAPPRKVLEDKSKVRDFTAEFLKIMSSGTTTDAFALLKSVTPDADADIDATRDKTLALLDGLRENYGKPIGYDIVEQRALGDSVIRIEALLKLEKYAIRCTMVFYKPFDKWLPARINFDPDLNALFDELNYSNGSSRRQSSDQQ